MKKPIVQGLCALPVFFLLFFCSCYLCFPVRAQLFDEQSTRDNTRDSAENSAKDIDIQNADLLEIEDDKIILTGNVKVKSSDSSGKDMLVSTQKLIALKDAAGEVYEVQTLTRSDITSEDFKLSADLLTLKKDSLTGRFNVLFADGNVLINSTDSSQTLKSPKVRIDLDKKKLYAYDGVITERTEKKAEGAGATEERKSVIKSEKQLIDLDREKEKLSPVMTLLAVGKPVANVNNDEIIATGDEIRIYTQNSEMKRVEVNNSAKVLAKQDGKNFDLASDEIELQEHPGKSLVRAFARDPKKKASVLKTTDQTATADEIVIIQNKENKEKSNKSDEKSPKEKNLLLLYGNARLIDKDGRKLNSAFAKIDLDRKDLFAGLVSRATGSIDKVDKEKLTKK